MTFTFNGRRVTIDGTYVDSYICPVCTTSFEYFRNSGALKCPWCSDPAKAAQESEEIKKQSLKLKSYNIISRAVEEGIAYALNRAFKYSDTPAREDFETRIRDAVMGELSEVVDWEDGL